MIVVYTKKDSQIVYKHGEYSLLDYGVLKITHGNKVILYSPKSWISCEIYAEEK